MGNLFVFKRRKKEDYMNLKNRMLQKLEGWRMRLLSYAERLTLIKTVAAAMPVYMMSTNKIPLSTCRELDALVWRYWWIGNSNKDRFMAMRSWDKIC
ncbi:hypothetical protein G4B88_030126 [Cannabis sativa]|uniref:Reverse transcriptase n=1 Tax=Cannabis sativa TaxID=3483 RepID=A0A7J6DQV1_CANSA|nr:hypothetical protein G4B88_030126 [Cannabis sativa]